MWNSVFSVSYVVLLAVRELWYSTVTATLLCQAKYFPVGAVGNQKSRAVSYHTEN